MKVLWTWRARKDLAEIAGFIANDRPAAARRWLGRVRARAKQIAAMPNSGRIVPEFSVAEVRELIEGGYRLLYQIFPDRVEILTVFEGHRLMPIDPPESEPGSRE